MKEKITLLQKEIEEKIKEVKNLDTLNELKVKYLSKKGPVSELTNSLRDLSIEEKKEFGKLITDFRNDVITKVESLKEKYELEELNKKLESEKVDISMPGMDIKNGSPSIVEKVVDDASDFFISLGYDVYEGPEIELDKYNFEMLNLPKDHPARDAQDTYYLKDEDLMLRSQTSPVQVRVMLDGKGETPIRMICPGKTYRREDINATHEQEFTQIEGLVIDKNISLSDLKGTFDAFVKHTFGETTEARFRPSYYPFTEPSVEMDMSCIYCDGSGCNMCKPKGWITIAGGGMVHPNVLRMCGYDPEKWQGFAFGMAGERIAMLKYNMTDMRTMHENDLRETDNFDRKEVK
ncbi:MAG: phenylalanine--tRNA ligase subunit alpha [Bacilli bacterium]|nr:phenylalanine--tRNA ligase subunit alpha [Bacilli bacterium]